jgi:Fe-S cluster assembly iron-binding protein IscA
MVNVTERAKEKLKTLRESAIDDPSVGLRLEPMPSGQLAVFPDRERADDQVVEHQGAVVLLVAQEIAQRVGNTTIDYEESHARFVLRKD